MLPGTSIVFIFTLKHLRLAEAIFILLYSYCGNDSTESSPSSDPCDPVSILNHALPDDLRHSVISTEFLTRVANSPGLTRIIRVSAFDLRSSGLVLQSPG